MLLVLTDAGCQAGRHQVPFLKSLLYPTASLMECLSYVICAHNKGGKKGGKPELINFAMFNRLLTKLHHITKSGPYQSKIWVVPLAQGGVQRMAF